MGHTNSTPNYGLPQFLGTDKPAWLSDVNQAYSDIDTGIYTAQAAADGAQNTADSAVGGVATVNTRVDGVQNQLNTVSTQASNTAATVGTHTTQIGSLSNSVNTINGRLGNTDISSIGDGTVTGALDALNQGGGGSGLSDVLIADGSGATAAAQLASLQTAFNNMTTAEKRDAYLDVLGNHVNISSGNGVYVLVSTGGTTEGFLSITNAKLYTRDTAVGGAPGNLTDASSAAITMSLRTLR